MRYTQNICDLITTKGTVTTKQLRKAFPKLTAKQISMALFLLSKKKNLIERIGFGMWKLKANELTPVNTPVAKPKTSRAPYNSAKAKEIADLKAKLEEANREILHWHRLAKDADSVQAHANRLEHDLKEALVLIRYLENKLFIAIQFDAKNNGNA